MKIKFIFSNQYEQVIARNPVSFQDAIKSLKSIERLWDYNGKNIENELFNITGLKFIENEVTCYVNSRASFSDPFSLKISDPNTMLDNLTHELIHVILTQNYKSIEEKMVTFHKKYSLEVFLTRIHVLVHAIHIILAEKIFPNRVSKIHGYANTKEYRRAWNIVDETGPQVIVDKVFKS